MDYKGRLWGWCVEGALQTPIYYKSEKPIRGETKIEIPINKKISARRFRYSLIILAFYIWMVGGDEKNTVIDRRFDDDF